MSLSPAMAALAARTAKAWRDEQECSKCGDAHPVTACTYVPTCHYCSAPAVITSAIGLTDKVHNPVGACVCCYDIRGTDASYATWLKLGLPTKINTA